VVEEVFLLKNSVKCDMYCPSWHICKKRHISGYKFTLGIRDTASDDCSRDLGTTDATVIWFIFFSVDAASLVDLVIGL
jgi:hypothetical protein